jgi:hypothetical protein
LATKDQTGEEFRVSREFREVGEVHPGVAVVRPEVEEVEEVAAVRPEAGEAEWERPEVPAGRLQ